MSELWAKTERPYPLDDTFDPLPYKAEDVDRLLTRARETRDTLHKEHGEDCQCLTCMNLDYALFHFRENKQDA